MDKEVQLGEHHAGDRFVRFIDWLNHKLVSAIGPPNVGPFDAVVAKLGEAVCPVCDRVMAEHTIDHSTPNAVLNCPADHKPEVIHTEKLNELGMPKRPA